MPMANMRGVGDVSCNAIALTFVLTNALKYAIRKYIVPALATDFWRSAVKDKRNATLKNSALRFWKLLSAVLYTWLFAQCWMHFYVSQMVSPYQWKGNLAVALLYCLISVLFIRVYRGYAVSIISGSEVVYSQSLGLFLCNCVAYILLVLLCERLVTPLPLLGLQAVQMVMVFLWTKVACWIDAALSRPQETVIVYRDREDVAKVYTMYRFAQKYHVVETVENPKNYYDATARLGGIKKVFIVGVDATVRNGILKYCLDEGIDAYVIPKVGDIILRGAKMHISGDEAFLRVCRSAQTVEHAIIKRATDIVVSLLGLVILSPVMAVTAIAIKCNDGGPVLYRQKRLTRNGKVFEILKFRTMRVDAEKDGVARLAAEGDDRITSVGRVVRRYRIDELMQLVNVLRGEMSLVGPRPERPEIAARYEKTMPAFSLRLQVKAGVTGYAQIYGKYNTEPYEKLQMDLVYINNMSVFEDLKLLLATVKVLFMKESTEGVDKQQVTAEKR